MSTPGEPPLTQAELAGDIASLYQTVHAHSDRMASLRQAMLAIDSTLATLLAQHPPTQVFRWENLTDAERHDKHAALTSWVDTISARYHYEEIPGCPHWATHDALVEELTALWIAWTAAYSPGAHPTEPLRWHEALHRARDRFTDLRGGCTPTDHHPSLCSSAEHTTVNKE